MNAHVELILAMVFASFMAILIILCQLLFGYYSNEMATLHLIKSYCVPSVLYGCETWYLDRHDYRRLNILWNNTFRTIFKCCWRENVSQTCFIATFFQCHICLTYVRFYFGRRR